MEIGILYNIFVCFISGFTGLAVFYFLQKRRKKEKIKYSQGLDYFSLFLGLVWILAGIRNIFVLIGRPDLNVFFSRWISEPLLYIHILPALYYFGWSFFQNNKKVGLLFDGFFTITVTAAVITCLIYGVIPGEITPWGMKNKPNPITDKIFTFGVFLPGAIIIIIEFLRRVNRLRKDKSRQEKQLFGFSLGFLIYVSTGALEVLVFSQDWLMLLARVAIMVAPLTFYWSATWE
ncbi:MAG: hypothetical protein GF370_01300 [Candidatus Nealsonbacteria bacterium]|nr:hypothetical protein [Candidatus Nealsonbacteria bacterium]